MRIKECIKIVSRGHCIQTSREGVLMYMLDGYTYCNNNPIIQGYLRVYPSLNDEIYLESFDPCIIYKLDITDNSLSTCVSIPDGYIRLGHSNAWFVYWNYQNEKDIYTCVKDGECVWTTVSEYGKLIQIQGFGLLYDGIGEAGGSCQLIDLSTGSVLWELDYPGANIRQVYPYEDKVIIVWFRKPESKSKNRVLCVEVPSGKVLWENDAAKEYKKYGDDKLVCFYVHYWEDGNDDRDLYTELNVHTGEVYTRRYLGYNANVFVTTIYKDYLFYGAEKWGAYVGAINLRTYEMLPEVKVDFTPGGFNQIASIGVYDGQLYVEIQTELNHSDIHVLDLEEDE